MYMNRNRRMHGCRHRFKRLIMSILVLSMLLTVTGCGGASQTAGSRLNTQNAVDKVLNQKTGDGDVESKSSAGATIETTITTEMQTTTETESASVTEATSEPTYGQVVNGDSSVIAQYKSEGVDVDLTLMGSDLVYATVYQMMSKPEEYESSGVGLSDSKRYDLIPFAHRQRAASAANSGEYFLESYAIATPLSCAFCFTMKFARPCVALRTV